MWLASSWIGNGMPSSEANEVIGANVPLVSTTERTPRLMAVNACVTKYKLISRNTLAATDEISCHIYCYITRHWWLISSYTVWHSWQLLAWQYKEHRIIFWQSVLFSSASKIATNKLAMAMSWWETCLSVADIERLLDMSEDEDSDTGNSNKDYRL